MALTLHKGAPVSALRLRHRQSNDDRQKDSKSSESESIESSSQQGDLVGLLILELSQMKSDQQQKTMHLGYLFGEKYWGKGLATELVRGLIQHLQTLKYAGTQVFGGVEADNPASAAVLVKAGFERLPGATPVGATMYQITI